MAGVLVTKFKAASDGVPVMLGQVHGYYKLFKEQFGPDNANIKSAMVAFFNSLPQVTIDQFSFLASSTAALADVVISLGPILESDFYVVT